MRHLILVLGDQLNLDSSAFDDFDPDRDAVWMAEVDNEATHVPSHKARIAIFLSAMRHFRDRARKQDYTVHYRELDDSDNAHDLGEELRRAAKEHNPEKLIVVWPGEWRVKSQLEKAAEDVGIPLEIREDRHFLCSVSEFAEHAKGRKQLRLEYFYREMRKRHGWLMDGDDPEGGEWNFDKENRDAFSKSGPENLKAPKRFRKDSVTKEVLDLVESRFQDHPGSLERFDWPVKPEHARKALDDFVENRLAKFGDYQDAMWTDEPYLYHSRLSAALNLKLLDPRDALEAAERAYQDGKAPLNAVEGFVRQILGWREFVRGVYWLEMPKYLERNVLRARAELPDFFWSGDTDMHCLSQAIGQTWEYGYAHHIHRLMVTGLFCLLYGVDPQEVHQWYLAAYVDAVEWVELPNSLGMSQYADNGIMASKPYAATGKYINRMSNYCKSCRFDPEQATGEDACPFTTLYWDFLDRHEQRLKSNNRMALQVKNLERKSNDDRKAIREQADQLKAALANS